MSNNVLLPPKTFPFPFPPYEIQQEFMKVLYTSIEKGQLGIFESPTGTGKSLSIICGALSWLKDHLDRERTTLEAEIKALRDEESNLDNEGDWLTGQSKKIEAERKRRALEERLNNMTAHNQNMLQLKQRVQDKAKKSEESHKVNKPFQKQFKSVDDPVQNDDEDLLLEDVEPSQTLEYKSDSESEEKKEVYEETQIIICSRTHSQLSQLVGEVGRSPHRDVRLVPLASRQSYCVNPAVRRLNSLALINERCTDLQRGSKGWKTKMEDGETVKKSKGSCSCPFLRKSQAVERLREEALATVQDVEALVTKGKMLSACPYYATRAAVRDAQVLVVPYNTLLHKETREACGLRVKGNIVIIDEAHNLLDSIAQVHNAQVTGYQLTYAYSQLFQYRDKYNKRFSPNTLLLLEQLLFVMGKLISVLGGKPGYGPTEGTIRLVDSKLFSLQEFLMEAGIGNINQFKLIEFAQRSKLSHKLHGFTERYKPAVTVHSAQPSAKTGVRAFLKEISGDHNTPKVESEMPTVDSDQPISNNPILPVLGFLQALTSSCADGRVVCYRQPIIGRGYLKYLLLNPATHFSDIVHQARSVIVAGGTMQPISEFKEQLFMAAGVPADRISHFSCGHVIPPDHILPIVLSSGPTNKLLDFSYQNRDSPVMMTELGRTLENMCNIVPGGVVCFFASYDYEQTVLQHLQKVGTIDRLSIKKKIFREPKKSNQVDQVLTDFASAVNTGKLNPSAKPNGALLFSVVGGKLSEGLNFSDDLGRCVIVVGMPYPNSKSPELREKLNYLDTTLGSGAGQKHYENLCMKAVNQCIGRAVRHRADYASVLLLDHRYARIHTQKLLPGWILDSLQVHENIGPAIGAVARFFAKKKKHNGHA